jgi:2-polyprenyl-3-methyl-5-hydroxy-6-metoxy-1,4-benzoquinol methylase
MDLHRRRYTDVAPYVEGRRVLDFASGAGYGTRLLADAGADAVIGVDLSVSAVQRARREFGGPGMHFLVGDAGQFCVRGPFDVVVSFETIEHLRDPSGFLRSLLGVLAPGGRCFLSAPLGETRHLDAYHQQVFDADTVVALVETAGFVVERTRVDPWRASFGELLNWRRLYPEFRPSWAELLSTRRGRSLLRDAVPGGIRIDELFVVARRD